MPHGNVIKKFQWEGINFFVIFGGKRIFSRASIIFKGGQVV